MFMHSRSIFCRHASHLYRVWTKFYNILGSWNCLVDDEICRKFKKFKCLVVKSERESRTRTNLITMKKNSQLHSYLQLNKWRILDPLNKKHKIESSYKFFEDSMIRCETRVIENKGISYEVLFFVDRSTSKHQKSDHILM